MKRWLIGGIAGGGALVLAAGATAFALSGQASAPEPTITPVVQVIETPAPKVTPTPTPVVEVAVPVVPVIEEIAPPPPAPELCPSGTIAGGVDDAGNEFNCYELNENAEVCGGYDDANNCTLWYRP